MTDDRVGTGRRVLLVEDEPKLRAMLERAVREMEFEPVAAGSAEDGLALLAERPFEVVISDLNLPGMGGMDMCALVRERHPQTQIVILTGYGDLDAAKRAIRLDVVDFITKPCTLRDLEEALDRALRRVEHHIIPRTLPEHDPFDEPDAPTDAAAPDSAVAPRLQDVERDHILAALERNDGNRQATAAELGISVRTLYYRLNAYERQGWYRR